jgi:phenylacetic acid degradation operon negative regulatory protein
MLSAVMDVPNVLNQAGHRRPEDPRVLLSEPFRAVHFVYGLFHPGVGALSGRALVGSLGALGFGPEAARGVLLRLRRSGFLTSSRSGREATYALSARSVALVDEIARRSSEPPPPWDGSFETLIVRIDPSARAFREQLRRHAAYAGFGMAMPGLLIAPYASSVQLVQPLLATARPGVEIIRGRLSLRSEDAAVLAAEAWDLGPTASALRVETRRMLEVAGVAETEAPEGADALRMLWLGIGPFFEVLSRRPPLPATLLPHDWPFDDARAAFVRLAIALAGPARVYVEDLEADRVTRPKSPRDAALTRARRAVPSMATDNPTVTDSSPIRGG